MSDQTSIWKKEFKLRKRGEATAVEPAAAPAVKTGSGSVWKKELKLGKSPKGAKKSAKKPDQATTPTTDAAAPTASKWKKELRMRRAVPARKPSPDSALESAESALLGTVFHPEGAPMHDQWSASLAPAPMPLATDDQDSPADPELLDRVEEHGEPGDLLPEADSAATSQLDEAVRDSGGYEFGPPPASSEEVAFDALVERENGHDSTGSYSADSYVAHPYADNDQSVDVARLAAAPVPYGGGDEREPDESVVTFGGSPWEGEPIVPVEPEVDESPQLPSWASSAGYPRPAYPSPLEYAEPAELHRGDSDPVEEVDVELGEPAEWRDAEPELPTWASHVEYAEPADALTFDQSEPQQDADQPRDVDPGMTTYQRFPTFGAETDDTPAPLGELPYDRGISEPDDLSVSDTPWAAGTVDVADLTPLTDDVDDATGAGVDLGLAFAAEPTAAGVEAHIESLPFVTELDEEPISDPAQSFDSQASEVEDEPNAIDGRVEFDESAPAVAAAVVVAAGAGAAIEADIEHDPAVEPSKSKKKLKARGAKGAPRAAKSSGRATQMVGVRAGSSQIVAAVVRNSDSTHELLQLVSAPLERGIIVGGEVREPEALAAELKKMFSKHKLPRKGIRLGIASNRVGLRTLEIAPIDDQKLFENAIRFHAQELLPIPLGDAILDHVVLGETEGPDGPLQRVLIAFAHRDLVDRYVSAFKSARLKVAAVDVEAFALLRALGPGENGNGATPDRATVVVAVGQERTIFAVAEGSTCDFTRVLEWGGGALTVAMARSLDMTPSQAEPIKRLVSLDGDAGESGLSPESLEAARGTMRTEIQVLARELLASLQFYQSKPGSLPIGELLLTGGGSELGGLPATLQESLGVPVRVVDPFQHVKAGKKTKVPADRGAAAIAIGLGMEA